MYVQLVQIGGYKYNISVIFNAHTNVYLYAVILKTACYTLHWRFMNT